jgi:hypothetical protein
VVIQPTPASRCKLGVKLIIFSIFYFFLEIIVIIKVNFLLFSATNEQPEMKYSLCPQVYS